MLTRTDYQEETGGQATAGDGLSGRTVPYTPWNPQWIMQERELEERADALLKAAPPSELYPAYTELQMARHGAGIRRPLYEDAILTTVQSRQDFLNDLKFLASMTPLSPPERCVLRAWMYGYSQGEMIAVWPLSFGTAGQQQVSRLLHRALRKCYAGWELSFAQFSHHSIYRRPTRGKDRQAHRMERQD